MQGGGGKGHPKAAIPSITIRGCNSAQESMIRAALYRLLSTISTTGCICQGPLLDCINDFLNNTPSFVIRCTHGSYLGFTNPFGRAIHLNLWRIRAKCGGGLGTGVSIPGIASVLLHELVQLCANTRLGSYSNITAGIGTEPHFLGLMCQYACFPGVCTTSIPSAFNTSSVYQAHINNCTCLCE